MISENKRNLTEKEEYYKLITDEKSNHIETNANGAGSQCVRRKNIGSLSFRERYLSLRKEFSNSWILFFAFKGGIRKLVVFLVNNALLAELSPTIVKAYFPVAQQPW